MSRASEFERALQRPKNFFELSGGDQWRVDENLDILDWDGGCAHKDNCRKCSICGPRWEAHWDKPKPKAKTAKEISAYIAQLESNSFEGWTVEQAAAYLTATGSIKKFIKGE